MSEFLIRESNLEDVPELMRLYKKVSTKGGLGRTEEEINADYISDFLHKCQARGKGLILYVATEPNKVIGEINGYTLGLKTFAHVFEQITMVIDPAYQGLGLGKKLLQALQTEIQNLMPWIMKMELACFSNNAKALQLYLSQGFIIEGKRKNRVRLTTGEFADGLALGWFNPNYKPAG